LWISQGFAFPVKHTSGLRRFEANDHSVKNPAATIPYGAPLERAGGEMVVDGTQADAQHSGGELSERGKQVWRNGSGMDGGSKLDGGKP
jgi:hypothetical protein